MTGELILALETSTRPASIAVAPARGAPELVLLDDGRPHASDLMPAVAETLRARGAAPSDLGRIVVGTGPGSYTGLRVGAAIALGLHRGAGSEVMGVPSFEAIAHAALVAGERGAVVRNAFGGQLYVAVYHRTPDGVEIVQAPSCTEAGRARDLAEPASVWLCDEPSLEALGDSSGRECRTASPRADSLLELGRERAPSGDPSNEVRPLYLRPFDAKVRRR